MDRIKTIYTKTKIKKLKTGSLGRKTAKKVIYTYMCHSVKKIILKVKKSFAKHSAWSKNFPHSEKYSKVENRFKTVLKLQGIAINSNKWKIYKSLSNSQYCLMLNEINCKPKRWRKSKTKLRTFNFLTTEKIHNDNKYRCQDMYRTIRTRTRRKWTQCKKQLKKRLILHFWKLKIKLKKSR